MNETLSKEGAERLWRQNFPQEYTWAHADLTEKSSLIDTVWQQGALAHKRGFMAALVLTGKMEAK